MVELQQAAEVEYVQLALRQDDFTVVEAQVRERHLQRSVEGGKNCSEVFARDNLQHTPEHTYLAISSRTLLANREGSSFSSSDGV